MRGACATSGAGGFDLKPPDRKSLTGLSPNQGACHPARESVTQPGGLLPSHGSLSPNQGACHPARGSVTQPGSLSQASNTTAHLHVVSINCSLLEFQAASDFALSCQDVHSFVEANFDKSFSHLDTRPGLGRIGRRSGAVPPRGWSRHHSESRQKVALFVNLSVDIRAIFPAQSHFLDKYCLSQHSHPASRAFLSTIGVARRIHVK